MWPQILQKQHNVFSFKRKTYSIKCHRSASLVSHVLLISHLKDDLNGKHLTLLRVWNLLWLFYGVDFKESDWFQCNFTLLHSIYTFFSFFISTHFLHTQGYEWLSVNLSVISTFVLPYLPYLLHYYSWARCCILKHSSLPCNAPLSFECMCCTQKLCPLQCCKLFKFRFYKPSCIHFMTNMYSHVWMTVNTAQRAATNSQRN